MGINNMKDSLALKNPKLSKQWHPSKNEDLTPNDVTTGSHKKVWWLCEKGHDWQATIASRRTISKRGKGSGCPFCSGKLACSDNSLQVLNPELSRQWHPSKNGDLTPNDVTIGSKKKVWWQCKKGHEWEATICNRTNKLNQTNCPYCANKKVCKDNCLQTLNPELSKQWHSSKNGNLTPINVTVNSGKKVWWQCERKHEWKANINDRTRGRGCPICDKENKTSFPEQAIYFYLKKFFNDTLNRKKFSNKWEIDIFIPSLNFGIEYDGIYYHKNRRIQDSIKEKNLRGEGICLLRVIEKDNTKNCYLKNNVIYCNKNPTENQLNEVIKTCLDYIYKKINRKYYIIDINVKRDRAKIYSLFIKSEKEKSFFAIYPELSKQWHRSKNLEIEPDMVKAGSKRKIWWQCEKGHEWEATVINRVHGRGCPYCSGQNVCNDNCLQTLNPILAKQWHSYKNGDLFPKKVTANSGKKVWWQCKKGHEWKATIASRNTGYGCPFCSGRYTSIDNCLQVLNPKLAKQWHPNKNIDLTPNNVTTGSDKKVWWQCEKGHEWKASVKNRTKGRGCPFCAGKLNKVNNK
jgi:hypothetical protein